MISNRFKKDEVGPNYVAKPSLVRKFEPPGSSSAVRLHNSAPDIKHTRHQLQIPRAGSPGARVTSRKVLATKRPPPRPPISSMRPRKSRLVRRPHPKLPLPPGQGAPDIALKVSVRDLVAKYSTTDPAKPPPAEKKPLDTTMEQRKAEETQQTTEETQQISPHNLDSDVLSKWDDIPQDSQIVPPASTNESHNKIDCQKEISVSAKETEIEEQSVAEERSAVLATTTLPSKATTRKKGSGLSESNLIRPVFRGISKQAKHNTLPHKSGGDHSHKSERMSPLPTYSKNHQEEPVHKLTNPVTERLIQPVRPLGQSAPISQTKPKPPDHWKHPPRNSHIPAIVRHRSSAGNKSELGVDNNLMQRLPAEREGYLMKKGKLNRQWKNRFCRVVQHTMLYYKDEFDAQPAGSISLKGATVQIPRDIKYENSFSIKAKKRTFFFFACSQQERKDWLEVLSRQVG